MKNARAIFGIVIVSIMVVASVQAATSDSVTATVTVQNISVSLDQTSFSYGTMPSNSASSTLTLWSAAGIVATNNGNVTEDFDVYGADTADWTLAAAAGADEYVHQFCNDTDNDCGTPPANYTAMTTNPQALKSSVAAAGTMAFQLRITTPNPSTVFTEQSASVTVQASAS